jgi:biopolymer transport protein ExbD/DNA-directed RNA polymerase subunit RPC12/RpoP
MSIEVKCLECGATHSVNDRLAGRRVRCPKCETAVHVPERDQPVQAAQTADPELPADLELPAGDEMAAEPVSAAALVMPPEAVEAATVPSGTVNVVLSPQPVSSSEQDSNEDDEPVLVRNKRGEDELDMTPMVDVTFLLLIFFTVTAAFSLQKSIEMPRQQTDAPSTAVIEQEEDDLDMVEVEVDEFGGFLVMAPDFERETPGKQNLITALKEAIAGAPDGMRLIIKVHELAKLRALVDAMDAGTIAGYKELEVTQVDEFN